MTGREQVEVCATSDLQDGEQKRVEVGDREIGVFNVEGNYYAIANYCPHRGGPICDGDIMPALVGEWTEPGERTKKTITGDPSITCPWHGWEFDLQSGHHLGDDNQQIPTYSIIEEDGVLYVVP